jgi:hypothetical protein
MSLLRFSGEIERVPRAGAGVVVSTPISADLRDRLLLHLTPGLGPIRTAALLERFGTPAAILGASPAELQEVQYIGQPVAEAITRARQSTDVDGELARIEKFGVRLVAISDPEYPSFLANIPDPPQVLYVRGPLTPADDLAVAVVGSRSCTEYGKRVAGRLATGLARAGVTVVSGLPHGTSLNTFLSIPFTSQDMEACKEVPSFVIVRVRDEEASSVACAVKTSTNRARRQPGETEGAEACLCPAALSTSSLTTCIEVTDLPSQREAADLPGR